ncbi:MAG: CRISPR-associated endonuclease Cas1 [Candidatus Diapherotrites archaeon]
MNISIEGFGTYLSKKGQRIVISQKNIKKEFAIYKIDALLIECRGISISSDLIKELQKEKINILFCDRDKPIAFINYLEKNPLLTKELLLMSESKKILIIRELITKKINGQMEVLKSLKKTELIKNLDEEEKKFQKIKENLLTLNENFETQKSTIFSLEAEFAQNYWRKLSEAIPPEYNFITREKRQARDALNCSLNYGYAILTANTLNCCIKAGLDPTIGILHSIQEGRKSLVFDIMEPFRPIIDRTIITLFTKKIFDLEQDFNYNEFLLSKSGKEKVATQVLNTLKKDCIINNKNMLTEKAILYTCYTLRDFITNKKNYFYVVLPK